MGNKNIVLAFILFGLSFEAFAQGIPIQLMVVDQNGFEKVNHSVKLRLTLTNDTSNTTGQYQEVHITQTNDFGIVSASLGKGVATTNSSVYGIEQFAFSSTEPFISIELDTSSSSTQYYSVGTIEYAYPMVSQRALKADSSDYSLNAINAEYSDTAEFARNFNESLDNDTSSANELQDLNYDSSSGDLTISGGNTVNIKQNNDLNGVAVLVEEIPNNADLSGWQAADSLFLYKWNMNILWKAPLSDPTDTSSINVGFFIITVSPYDSIVFGATTNTSSPYGFILNACRLDGTSLVSKTLSTFPSNVRTHGDTINFFASTTCFNWVLSSNMMSSTFSYVQQSSGQNYCNGAVGGNGGGLGRFANYYLSFYQSGQGYNCTTYIVDRFTGSTVATLAGRYTSDIDYFSNSGLKHFLSYSYDLSTDTYPERFFNFSPQSQQNTGSSDGMKLIRRSRAYDKFLGYHDMIGEDNDGQYLFSNIFAQGSTSIGAKEQLFVINSNNIDSSEPIIRLLMSDWSILSPLSTGTYYLIEVRDEFLLVLDRVSNFIVNGASLNGSYIVHIPKN